MTYGWSILVIAIALVVLFELGVFNSNSLSGNGACIAQSGYLCEQASLSSNGVLSAQIGSDYGSISVSGIACTTNSTLSPSISSYNTITSIKLNDGESVPLSFQCPMSSNAIGTEFNGQLWIEYTSGSSSTTQYTKIGTVSLKTTISSPTTTVVVAPTNPDLFTANILLSNEQSSSVSSNFQEMIYFSPSAYSSYVKSNLSNIEFSSGAPIGTSGNTPLYAWIESGASSTATNTVIWINLGSNTIGAAGSGSNTLKIYMNFLNSNSPVTSGYTGYPSQNYCSNGCYQTSLNQYDNIQNVMKSGLAYQIYYTSVTCDSTSYESALYSALLGNQITVSGCSTFTSNTPVFNTPVLGTSQSVDGTTEQNVIINYQESYSGGSAYPNPPVINNANSWQIKAIGWGVLSNPTMFTGVADDGESLSSTSSITSSTSYWLGGTSSPDNVFSYWLSESATAHNGIISNPGTYRLEYNYYENGGGAYTALYSSNSVSYYSPSYPPNGIPPSFSITT